VIMAKYRLTPQAESDLFRIYEYGVLNFGANDADDYYWALFERFDHIAEQPKLYPAVDHIREGYRRSVYKADSIYYRIADDGIVEIITILGRQNEIGVFEELF